MFKKTVMMAWVAVGLPLVTVLAASLRPAHFESLVSELGELKTGSRIVQMQTGADRVGGHAAVLDLDGNLHMLRMSAGRLAEQVLPAATWHPTDVKHARLAFVDTNCDDLLDLVASDPPPKPVPGSEPGPREWSCAVFLQRDGGFVFDHIDHQAPRQSVDQESNHVQDGGQCLRLLRVMPEAPAQQCTHLIRDDDGRLQYLLPGAAHWTLDFDEDGNDDLVTSTTDPRRPHQVLYRMWLFRRNGFQQVWEASFRQPDPNKVGQRLSQVIDLSGGSRPIVVICEPGAQRISAWALSAWAGAE